MAAEDSGADLRERARGRQHGRMAPSAASTLALRERFRERYQRELDPLLLERLRWRAHVVRQLTHLIPGQTILELGCGSGLFSRTLREQTRGENPITAVTFLADAGARPPELPADVEFHALAELPGALRGRTFDHVVALDMLDRSHCAPVLEAVHALLAPGGQFVFYETNPWNPALKIYRALGRLLGRDDPRSLLSRAELYELISETGFVHVFALCNDFLYRPLTRALARPLRSVNSVLENTPGVRAFAGSILVHARKPALAPVRARADLATHAALRGEVSVVVPCRDEERNVEPLLDGLRGLYDGYLREVIFAHDPGSDGTRAVLERLAHDDARVKPLFRTPPGGVGRALADGIAAAGGRYVLTLDCDFAPMLPELRDLFDAVAAGADVAIGSRFSPQSVVLNDPLAKILANRLFHALARLLLWRRLHDVTNNLKLMTRDVARRLVLAEPGFAVNAELGLEPLLMGARVAELPVSWVQRGAAMGSSSFRVTRAGGGYARVLARALLARWFRRGRYRAVVAAPR
jgi:SAM-dependent methyltransferase